MANPGKRTIASLPSWAVDTATELARLGYGESHWKFYEEWPVPDRAHRLQVRNVRDLAPIETVNTYAENMRNGDKFPPIVVSADETPWLLDGNTRAEAAWKIARKGTTPMLPAFVLDECHDGVTTATRNRHVVLAVAFNNKHGHKMSAKDTEAAITSLLYDDISQSDTARLLHVPLHVVKSVASAHRAASRIASMGLDPSSLSRTTLNSLDRLGSDMYDEPFRQMAEIVIKTGMGNGEAVALMGELNELRSEGGQLRLLEGVRESRSPQMTGLARKSTLALQAAKAYGFFLKYADDPTVLAQTGSRDVREAWMMKAYQVAAVIRAAADSVKDELGRG